MVIVLLWLVIYSLINIDLPQHNKKTIKDNIKDNIKDIIKGNIKDDLKGDFRVRGCSSIMWSVEGGGGGTQKYHFWSPGGRGG